MNLPPSRARALSYLFLVIGAASWGGNWVAARAIYLDVPPFALVFWRWTLASLVLLPLALPHLARELGTLLSHWRALAAFGILGTAGFTMLGYWGIRYTTATNAVLLNSSLPVMVVPLAWLLFRHTINRRQVLGLALSLAGIVDIVSAGDPASLTRMDLNPGDAMILGAVLLWALYTVGLKWRPKLHPLSFLFATFVVGAAFATPFYAWETLTGTGMVLRPGTYVAIGYLVVFPSLVAYICWNHAVAVLGPNIAGFFNPLMPMFGTFFAIVILGEQFEPYHLLGFALVIAGVLLSSSR